MSSAAKKLLQIQAGAGEAVYVDDVFSTYVYTGNNSSLTITNGIDLAGEGGMVWTKERSPNARNHFIGDSERNNFRNYLYPNLSNAESGLSPAGYDISSVSSTGYSLGPNYYTFNNELNSDQVSWTFRKQPGFFDVVTYTGDNTQGRNIPHALGSAPGMIIVKATGNTQDWAVWHRSLSDTNANRADNLFLNTTSAAVGDLIFADSADQTSTHFRTGNTGTDGINYTGRTYVAYLFAHDAQDFGTNSDESIIKCGSYTGNGSTTGPEIDLGFEPQWLLIKRSDSTGSWFMWDTMRGLTASSSADPYLIANGSSTEAGTTTDYLNMQATGFQLATTATQLNNSGAEYIYVAIRRPHKPASEFAATDLFAIDTSGGTSPTPPRYNSGFPVDLVYQRSSVTSASAGAWWTRATVSLLYPSTTDAESTSSSYLEYFAENEGFQDIVSVNSANYVWMFRRAPGFFDVAAYTGTGVSGLSVTHNLTVSPELVILKNRTTSSSWFVFSNAIDGSVDYGNFNNNGSFTNSSWFVMNSSNFVINTTGSSINAASNNYISYLFATVPGISKVGSYTGTGSDIDVDCGFTSGARFALVKRTDSTGDWYLWDSERGIVAGNDPYLLINSTAAQVTTTDYIDPLSSGFTITSSAPTALNNSGSTYLFLAIA